MILHEEQFTCAEGEDKADPYELWTKIGPYVCLKNQKLCRLSTPNEVIKHNQICSKTLNLKLIHVFFHFYFKKM